ncbi:hypothetical protein KKD49_02765, partial [Myxococcota bacterium]|nr:hypothetical protein [Myxococcota bacterium]
MFGFRGDVIQADVITPPPSRLLRTGLESCRLCGHRLMIRGFTVAWGFKGDVIQADVITPAPSRLLRTG